MHANRNSLILFASAFMKTNPPSLSLPLSFLIRQVRTRSPLATEVGLENGEK